MSRVGKKRLPPINALRGFEAAARRLSFTLAADELRVTQSAISYQIRELEEYLGTSLFRRLTRRVELTTAGEEFARLVKEGITAAELDDAVSAVLTQRQQARASDDVVAAALSRNLYLGRTMAWSADFDARLRALNIASLVTNADDARRQHYANNKTTIRVDVDPVKLLGPRLARNVTGISLKLVVRRNGQILSMEQTSGGGGAIVTTTLSYSNWNEPQQIAAPPREQIDPTPSVDEEAIAAFKDAPLFMPRGIPDGWTFSAARVFDADETTEGCREAMLGYENPNDPNAGYLEIYQFPVSCERPMTGSGVVAPAPSASVR